MFTIIAGSIQDSIILESIKSQLVKEEDNFIPCNFSKTPARQLDNLLREATEAIILISPNTGEFPPDYLKFIKSNYAPNTLFMIRTEDIIEGKVIDGKFDDISANDTFCFSKAFYRTNLREMNPFSSYQECINRLSRIVRKFTMLPCRLEKNYTKLAQLVSDKKSLEREIRSKEVKELEILKTHAEIKRHEEMIDAIKKENEDRKYKEEFIRKRAIAQGGIVAKNHPPIEIKKSTKIYDSVDITTKWNTWMEEDG